MNSSQKDDMKSQSSKGGIVFVTPGLVPVKEKEFEENKGG